MEDKSLVSDLEFDQLLKELQGLETAHPEFNDHSPHNVWGEHYQEFSDDCAC